jgi:hypothetical protein
MKTLIITSCTARKGSAPAPARDLYLGEQHRRIMAGIRRAQVPIDLWIFSALHGPIPGDEVIEPYDVTFATMHPADRRARKGWMAFRLRGLLARGGYTSAIVALGKAYADGVGLETCPLAQPTVFLGLRARQPQATVIPAGVAEARRFHVGVIGLKGELVARILDGSLCTR